MPVRTAPLKVFDKVKQVNRSKMRTRISLSALLLFLIIPFSFGQHWRTTPRELQLGIGAASYFGDIGGTAHENNIYGIRDLDIARSRPTAVGGMRYNQNRYLSLNVTAALGWLSGSDRGSRNESRDYVFNTVIFEPAGRIEFFPVRDILIGSGIDRRGMVRNYTTISAYLFAGAGVAFYHVMPNQNLKDRQNRSAIEHGPLTVVLPAGVGVKLGIRNFVDLGVEIGGRYAMNDYLDGFSSPSSTSNDIYYVTSVMLIYRFTNIYIE